MKIAIVAPSPVPFTIGGAEQLFWGMQDAIHEYTPHQCELVKIPTREDNFWNLIASYYSFYTLDLSHFDMVISTKYPSWMVQHVNHVVYLIHPLRGLYDTYHLCNLPRETPGHLRVGLVEEIVEVIHGNHFHQDTVNGVFENLRLLKEDEAHYSPETFQFPGPFIRDIIHFFDRFALSPERIQRYCTMSETVRQRQDYFPVGVNVDIIHPPPKLDYFTNTGCDYLFTASRLDEPKRIDLIINAMKYVPHDLKLKIAGTGPDELKLRRIAKDDKRIEFVGFVHEHELLDLYGRALAVVFTPCAEDYGLITLEAMLSRKPVITTTDSGGPLELVQEGQNGFVVEPDPREIAEKINYCIEHPEETRRMGENGYRTVQDITWENFARRLLGDDGVWQQKKKKILVLATYSCYPPRGGGQHRLYNLYSRLATRYDITICSIVESNKPYQDLTLKNGLRQICLPQSPEHAGAQWKAERKAGVNLYDVAMIDHVALSCNYVDAVKELMEQSDIVIFAHPYLFSLYKPLGQGKRVIYDAIDVEYQQKRDYIKNGDYLEEVFEIEKIACGASDVIFAISSENRELLVKLYDADPDKIFIVPNGVNSHLFRASSDEERERLKEGVGVSGIPTILFVGSWHPPNLRALRFIVKDLLTQCKNCLFLIIGSVKDYYNQEYGTLPKNVLAFGTVDEDEKRELYKLADIAINPMFGGSGTNLKMLDYMSAGIPVVTTPIGARGIPITNYEHAIVCPPEQMAGKIQELISDSRLREHLRNNARSLVEDGFSWDSIARRLEERLQKLLDTELLDREY
ncbi:MULTISPECIES: glycosyltransferase family 4 protein [unclassified Methanoculleus]|jgi:glycosyltransferase involved in cell wall biosynthesis|uniref:glycosyltransferase family 4 protein n=1 Tax=unclassified Methanoculleus TaxID=2619537 RepID=UPI0025D17C90|nr:glycosyltransferase family 4 protein [Methanoculleus sp. UBA377]